MFCRFAAFSLASTALAAANPLAARQSSCTASQRLAGAQLIINAYAQVAPGQSAALFNELPLTDDCHTYINPNGGPPIVVAIDSTTTKDFAIETRQIFSQVTGQFTDLPNNDTTIIHTNVTLGALHSIAVPVTFYADVYLFYDPVTCLMNIIQAFAIIPTVIAGIPVEPPILPAILNASPLNPKPQAPPGLS